MKPIKQFLAGLIKALTAEDLIVPVASKHECDAQYCRCSKPPRLPRAPLPRRIG